MRQLEESIVEEDAAMTPYFEDEFEGLCQLLDVDRNCGRVSTAVRLLEAKSALLARRATKMITDEASEAPAQRLVRLYQFLGLDRETGREMALTNRFHTSVLGKL